MRRLILIALMAMSLGAQPALRPKADAIVEPVNWTTGVAYTYDGAGEIVKIGADEMLYDDVGRVVQAKINGATRKYAYDAFGNRKSCADGATDCQFAYATSPSTNRLVLNGGITYDPADSGNVTQFRLHAYTYDATQMLNNDTISGVKTEFLYTADDERIATHGVNAGNWQWTVRAADGKVLREFTSQDGASPSWKWTKDYVWRGDLLLASRQPETDGVTTYHYHLDHLGSARRITNNNDEIIAYHDYYAFGPEVPGGMNEASRTDLKYTGHERNTDSEPDTLDYMHARYYSPSMGRFLSLDPVIDPEKAVEHPQKWNRYAYVSNRPFFATDPNGREIKAVFDLSDRTLTITDIEKRQTIVLKGVFSGDGTDQNNPKSAWKEGNGPIPPGKYLIGRGYERHPGESGDSWWYLLYGADGRGGYRAHSPGTKVVAPDGTIVYRTMMNIHTGLVSLGCVTVPSEVDGDDQNYPTSTKYDQLKKLFDKTKLIDYKGSKFTGWLTVKE